MFDIGWPELLLILIVGMVLFGPTKIEEVARSLGKSITAFKSGLRDGYDDTQRKA